MIRQNRQLSISMLLSQEVCFELGIPFANYRVVWIIGAQGSLTCVPLWLLLPTVITVVFAKIYLYIRGDLVYRILIWQYLEGIINNGVLGIKPKCLGMKVSVSFTLSQKLEFILSLFILPKSRSNVNITPIYVSKGMSSQMKSQCSVGFRIV